MKATKDNAVYIEKVVLQDDADTDFEKITDTTVNFVPNAISLLDTTTNTQLESEDELTENEEVLLIDANNNITDTPIGSVTTEVIDTTQTLDVFGDSSCIAAYPFDENTDDLNGNYNATINGNVSYVEGRYSGYAIHLDNASTQIDTGIKKTDTNFGISFWVNSNDGITANKRYVSLSTSGTEDSDICGIFTYNELALIVNGSPKFSTPNFTTGEWHHIYFDTEKLIMDGKLITDNNESVTRNGGSDTITIGDGVTTSNDQSANASFDQVRIFNRELTEDEIQQLYNEQKTKYIADISSANLSEAPTKAFKKQFPDISIACEATESDITDTSFIELTPETTTYDGSKFTTVYSDLGKEGRAIQRKIIAPNAGIEVIEPFTSNLWKKDS